MNTLKIIKQEIEENPFFSEKWIVKNNRKKFAVIFHKKPGYSVTVNGILWEKNTFEQCIDQCNEMADLIYSGRVIFCKINSYNLKK